jgi:hypothetical protein
MIGLLNSEGWRILTSYLAEEEKKAIDGLIYENSESLRERVKAIRWLMALPREIMDEARAQQVDA